MPKQARRTWRQSTKIFGLKSVESVKSFLEAARWRACASRAIISLMRKPAMLALWVLFGTSIASAQTIPLVNGNFEAGTLTGWTAGGENGGQAYLVREGSCFSFNNTQALSLSGSF